jgi:hypothetical protein
VRTHYYIGRSAMAGFTALLAAQALGDVKMMNDRSVVDFIESVRPVCPRNLTLHGETTRAQK